MAYPASWAEAEAKLKQLFPDSTERGTIKGKLLQIPQEDQRLLFFQDDDLSVKAALLQLAGLLSMLSLLI
jgi:hypothetical protein